VRGFPSKATGFRGTPLKRRHFAAIGSNSITRLQIGTELLHIITRTGDRLLNLPTLITLNDLELQKRGFW